MTIRLNGSTSGYVELDAPAVAGNNTLVFPGGSGAADQVLGGNGAGALAWVDRGRMVLETTQASTSGTSIDFTGIPSWVKRVTVMFNGVSTNGTSVVEVRLGTSGGIAASGYAAACVTEPAVTALISNTGFPIGANSAASHERFGSIVIGNISGNTWTASLSAGLIAVTAFSLTGGGSVNLSGTLDRIRITTVNGTDTFDAGSINILYEG